MTRTITVATISVLIAVMIITSVALPVMAAPSPKEVICHNGVTEEVSAKRAQNLIDKGEATLGPCPTILTDSITITEANLFCFEYNQELGRLVLGFKDGGVFNPISTIAECFGNETITIENEPIDLFGTYPVDSLAIQVEAGAGTSFNDGVLALKVDTDTQSLSGELSVNLPGKGKTTGNLFATYNEAP